MLKMSSIRIRLFMFVLVPMQLAGCANTISEEAIRNADYGPPPPAGYQELIKADLARHLIDPTAPIYEFGEPAKGYTQESAVFNSQQQFGWKVCGAVNSKNRFGGYAGSAPFFVLFRDGQIVYRAIGDARGQSMSLKNSAIDRACMR